MFYSAPAYHWITHNILVANFHTRMWLWYNCYHAGCLHPEIPITRIPICGTGFSPPVPGINPPFLVFLGSNHSNNTIIVPSITHWLYRFYCNSSTFTWIVILPNHVCVNLHTWILVYIEDIFNNITVLVALIQQKLCLKKQQSTNVSICYENM